MKPDEAIAIVLKALAEIHTSYFHLKTTYEPEGIIRERVFCYELYHQIRVVQGKDASLTLNGEIDKRGHRDFAEGDQKNPDFIFHVHGTHEHNTVVCEVKGLICDAIHKDLDTLLSFVNKYNYKVGLFILYNHSSSQLIEFLTPQLPYYCKQENLNKIVIVCVPAAGEVENKVSLETIASIKK